MARVHVVAYKTEGHHINEPTHINDWMEVILLSHVAPEQGLRVWEVWSRQWLVGIDGGLL